MEFSEIIVALWFYPFAAMIFVLVVAVFGFLFHLLRIFKPVAGQKRKPIEKSIGKEKLA